MSRILLLGEDRDRLDGLSGPLREDGHRVEIERRRDRWTGRRVGDVDLVIAGPAARDGALACPSDEASFQTPLLVVEPDDERARPFLPDRFVDWMREPFSPEEMLGRVDALTRLREVIAGRRPGPSRWRDRWSDAGARLRALLWRRAVPHRKPLGPYLEVAASLAHWADQRDAYDPGHAGRVAGLCTLIAEGLGLDEAQVGRVLRAAMFHDVGKAGMSAATLNRPGPLEAEDVTAMRRHPALGARLIGALDADLPVGEAVRFHHERPDGKGYYGRTAEGIPRTASVLAVAEAYDAMTRSRIQRRQSRREALLRLAELAGERFDEQCVGALADGLRVQRSTDPED